MSKVVKVSDGAYQRIAEEASLQGIFLNDALDNLLFDEDSINAGEEEESDGTLRVVRDLVGVEKLTFTSNKRGS